MNNIEIQYLELLENILKNGVKKGDRTGTGTISIFGVQMKHDMNLGFPLLTTKKMAWKSMVVELLWFLKGRTDLKYLLDNKCYIWVGDAYKKYTKSNDDLTREEFIEKIKSNNEFSKKWGDLGKIYGHQWRKFNGVDQIENLINDLKNNPDSRRLMVNAWNPSELSEMILPPCFHEDTLISCLDGYKKIIDIKINDSVLTEDGTYQSVYDLHKTKYKGDILNIKVHGNSKYIKVTPNHKFLVRNKGYIDSIELSTDDYLGIPINKNNIIPKFVTKIKDNQYTSKDIEINLNDENFWFLMGYYLGDGWINENKKEIYFSINDEQVDRILPTLKKVLGLAKLNNSGEKCKKYVGKKQYIYEILLNFGKYAHGKKIPKFVYDAPKKYIEKFIDGYKMADGCDTKDGITFTTVSENIAYGIQLLYTKLGIKSSVYFQKRNKKTKIQNRIVNQKSTYSINIYKQKNKSKNYFFDNDFLWLKIKDINIDKNFDGYVYNISTEKNHTYNVYNLINHNCHYGFQCYTTELTFDERIKYFLKNNPNKTVEIKDGNYEMVFDKYKIPKRKLSLLWNQRSCDFPLGIPFNISSYALLLIILSKEVNMIPDELIAFLGDSHIYLNQIDGVKEQIKRNPLKLSTIKIVNHKKYDEYEISDFELLNYISHEKIDFPLSN